MRNLRHKYRALEQWLEQKLLKNHEWWERQRAKGELRYVLLFTVLFVGIMSAFNFLGYYISGRSDGRKLLFDTILYLILGILIGSASCWVERRKYKKSLNANLDATVLTKRPDSSTTKPNNSFNRSAE
jgi:uncharacterized protein YneF (UPF0154 family)